MVDPALMAKQAELDGEMVPLSVAATVAYFHLTALAKQIDTDAQLADVVQVVAVALSQVAPIYSAGAGAVEAVNRELDALLLRRSNEESPADLDRFAIRRGDLRTALTTLREARHLFGGRDTA